MSKHKEEPTPAPVAAELTQDQKLAAALNTPAFATDEEHFALGDRQFTVLDFDWDDYHEFIHCLQPLVDGIAQSAAGALFKKPASDLPGITLPSGINIATILKYSKNEIPKMITLICNVEAKQKDDKAALVTVEWVKKHLTTPMNAVGIVMKQVNKNKMISEIGSFFVQYLPQFQKAKSLFQN